MRSFARFLPLAIITAGSVSCFAQEAKPPLIISISTPDPVIKLGADIRLDLVIKNTSQQDVRFARSKGDAEFDYEIDARNQNGKEIPETAYGHKIHSKESTNTLRRGGMVLITLVPSQEYTQSTTLNKIYDFSEPGTYVIQVQRRNPEGKTLLKSNKLVVTVVE